MPRISEETIRKVAEATDIVTLIGSYFPLKRAGASYRALCPFHSEKTPSFHVNPARQSYRCFGCGAGGTVFRFLMDYEHVEFAEAVRRLAARAGIPVVEDAGGSDDRQQDLRKRLLALHAEAAAWFHAQLTKEPHGEPARRYLASRGFSSATAREWQLGYAPESWDALTDFLRGKGFSGAEMLKAGLAATKDGDERGRPYARFRGRLMFPIWNDYGEVIAFSGRVLDPDAEAAKYVNSPETPIFTKGRILYGLHKTKRALIASKAAIVCEGQLDLIRAFESGARNVIAPQGTAFTFEQARLLARFVESVALCFDSDRAGQEAAAKSLPSLLECGLQVRVVRLPEGDDPDSLIRREGAEAFLNAVGDAMDFFDDALERFSRSGAANDPAKTAAASRKLGSYLALVRDPVLRDGLAAKICARLGVSPKALAQQLRQTKAAAAPVAEAGPPPEERRPLELSEGMRVLCENALLDPESKEWLAAHGAAEASRIEEGGELLERIVAWPGDLQHASEAAAFASGLPERLERAWAAIETAWRQPLPEDAPPRLEITRQWWNDFRAAPLRARLSTASLRLREPGAPRDEILKEILDLRARLNELSSPAA